MLKKGRIKNRETCVNIHVSGHPAQTHPKAKFGGPNDRVKDSP